MDDRDYLKRLARSRDHFLVVAHSTARLVNSRVAGLLTTSFVGTAVVIDLSAAYERLRGLVGDADVFSPSEAAFLTGVQKMQLRNYIRAGLIAADANCEFSFATVFAIGVLGALERQGASAEAMNAAVALILSDQRSDTTAEHSLRKSRLLV